MAFHGMRSLPIITTLFLLTQIFASNAPSPGLIANADLSVEQLRKEWKRADKNATDTGQAWEEAKEKLREKESEAAEQTRIFEERNTTWSELDAKAVELKRPWEEAKRKAEEVVEEFDRLEREAANSESRRSNAEQDLNIAIRTRAAAKVTVMNVSLWRKELRELPEKTDLDFRVNGLSFAVKVKKSAFDNLKSKFDGRINELAERGCNRRPNDPSCKASSFALTDLQEKVEAARSEYETAESNLRGPREELEGYDYRKKQLEQGIADAGYAEQRVRDADASVETQQRLLDDARKAAASAAAAVLLKRPAADAARLRAAATPAPDAAEAAEAAQRADWALDDAKAVKRRLDEEIAGLRGDVAKAQEAHTAAQSEADSLRAALDTAQLSDDEKRGPSAGAISGITTGAIVLIILIVGAVLVYRKRDMIRTRITRKDLPEETDSLVVHPGPVIPEWVSSNPTRSMRPIEQALVAEEIPLANISTSRPPDESLNTISPNQRPDIARITQNSNRSDSGYEDASPRTTGGGHSADRKCSPYTAALMIEDDEPPKPFESEFLTKFKPIKILGQGGFGCVFEAEFKLFKYRSAIKRISLRYPSFLKKDADVLREAVHLANFEHPSIVRYILAWLEQPPPGWQRKTDEQMLTEMNSQERLDCDYRCAFLYIQMELCQGTLADWLKDNQRRDLKRIKHWFKQIVDGVGYIHAKEVIHRDLKPGNILFADEDRLKICDLGIASVQEINEGQENAKTRTFGQGTSLYMAPEQQGYAYKSKVDIFALGLILAELCVPMTDQEAYEVFENYRQARACDVLSSQPDVEQFVGWLTAVKPDERPECSEILKDAFLA